MELREKVAAAILEAMDVADGLDVTAAERYADSVLAIPEIRDALEAAKPIYIRDLTEESYGWPGKPDGVRRHRP